MDKQALIESTEEDSFSFSEVYGIAVTFAFVIDVIYDWIDYEGYEDNFVYWLLHSNPAVNNLKILFIGLAIAGATECIIILLKIKHIKLFAVYDSIITATILIAALEAYLEFDKVLGIIFIGSIAITFAFTWECLVDDEGD